MAFKASIKRRLEKILGKQWVKDDPVTLFAYRCDGLTLHTNLPMGVVFPADTASLIEVVKVFHEHKIAFLPRGAGTGLSGGAVPLGNSVIVEMVRFTAIEEIDLENRTITVGPGVVNLHISKAVEKMGFHFVPDPSSQKACTVGGNVAENAGGPHTLKYGVTVNHVLALEAVLPNGELLKLGDAFWGAPGPDLLALFVGSEGTFGIVTKVICRLTPLPESIKTMLAIFDHPNDASEAVSAIIAAGIVPSALEMMDQMIIRAVEDALKVGFPKDAGALLIIELEDLAAGLPEDVAHIQAILEQNGAQTIRLAENEAQRAAIWRARKEAFGALGKITPSFYTQDGVIPRSKLPYILEKITAIGAAYQLKIGNVFHAGDGNLHPIILYNPTDQDEINRTLQAGEDILTACLNVGGTLSGEHGIGLEKTAMMADVFSEVEMEQMVLIRTCFNPHNLLNPGKILPTPGLCGDMKLLSKKSGIAV